MDDLMELITKTLQNYEFETIPIYLSSITSESTSLCRRTKEY